jgi:hypothetical protein
MAVSWQVDTAGQGELAFYVSGIGRFLGSVSAKKPIAYSSQPVHNARAGLSSSVPARHNVPRNSRYPSAPVLIFRSLGDRPFLFF